MTTVTNQNPNDGSTIELLSFRIGDQEYSVGIMTVREIRGWTRATSIPHAPQYIRGVINLRGTVLPVIDLSARLGLQQNETTDRDVIIVIDIDGRAMGLLVNAVSDILTVPEEDFQPTPRVASSTDEAFISALTIVDGRMIRVLDIENVLPHPKEVAA